MTGIPLAQRILRVGDKVETTVLQLLQLVADAGQPTPTSLALEQIKFGISLDRGYSVGTVLDSLEKIPGLCYYATCPKRGECTCVSACIHQCQRADIVEQVQSSLSSLKLGAPS